MTNALTASGPISDFPNRDAFYARDLPAGQGQEMEFARQLQDFGHATSIGSTLPKKTPTISTGVGPVIEKKEPGEASTICPVIVPLAAVPQRTLPFSLELSLNGSAKKFTSFLVEDKAIKTAAPTQEAYVAAAKPQPVAMVQQTKSEGISGLNTKPADSVGPQVQFGADSAPDPRAIAGPGSAEMVEEAPEELTVAVRLQVQNASSPATAGAASRAVPTKEPRRLDIEDARTVQPVRDAALLGSDWNKQDVTTSAGPYAASEKPIASPDHLDVPPVLAERPAKAAEPLRNLSIQMGQGTQEKVELRVSEHAGEVRVAVRTADIGLQNGLRQNLPELVHRLEGQGYRADAWRPSGVVSATTPLTETRQSSPDFHGGDSQAKQGWSQQERGQHDQNHSDRPKWVEELECNLTGDGNRPTGANYGYIR